MLSIEFGANMVVFAELILHLTVKLSINVNYCCIQVKKETLNIEDQFLRG